MNRNVNFTAVSNDLLEKLQMSKFNGTQFRIICCILRFTAGFHRNYYFLSDTFVGKATNTNPKQVNRELGKLIKCNVVKVYSKGDQTTPREIGINSNTAEWSITFADQDQILSSAGNINDGSSTNVDSCTNILVDKHPSNVLQKKETINKITKYNRMYTNDCYAIINYWNSKLQQNISATSDVLCNVDMALNNVGVETIKCCIER